jgi:ArsR family transcriptional regulator
MKEDKKYVLEAQFLSVLAQSTRLKILYFLRAGEQCACKIYPYMKEDPSVISRHLVKMKEAGILDSRREGVSIYYWIQELRIFKILEMVDTILIETIRTKTSELAKVL